MLNKNNIYPVPGKVEWIGLRPDRESPQIEVQQIEAIVGKGLLGDRYSGKQGKRDVTLIQKEHLETVGQLLGKTTVHPSQLRRNIVVSGMNLVSLKGRLIRIGSTHLQVTGPCAPCIKMERNLGPGGYNAMRGHGGITAKVVKSGMISVGDSLEVIESPKVSEHESH
ncbi:MAG: MOSC domain-containing protein [Bacteroidia bacterium]|nr:MOSC domain-containing protein [Bacteroidia bacterium]